MKLALFALALSFPVPSHDLRGPVMAGDQVVVSDEDAGTLVRNRVATDGFDVAYAVRRCPGALVQRHPLGEAAPRHAQQRCPVRFGSRATVSRSRRSVTVPVRCPRGCVGMLTVKPSFGLEFFHVRAGASKRVVITLDERLARHQRRLSVAADVPDTTGRDRSYRARLRLSSR